MKNYIILFIATLLFSCKSSQLSPKNSLVSISKNPCLKYCEVSDLHIYSDGTFVYNGVLNVDKKGRYKGTVSAKQLIEIKETLNQLPKNISVIKGRDIPSVTIKYKSTNITYQANHKELISIKKLSQNIINSIP